MLKSTFFPLRHLFSRKLEDFPLFLFHFLSVHLSIQKQTTPSSRVFLILILFSFAFILSLFPLCLCLCLPRSVSLCLSVSTPPPPPPCRYHQNYEFLTSSSCLQISLSPLNKRSPTSFSSPLFCLNLFLPRIITLNKENKKKTFTFSPVIQPQR